MNNKWTYNCISIYIGSITRVINMVYKYMVIKILWKWWYMCTINVQVPCSSLKWILAWFSLVDWRLKLSIFDVMICKTLHDNTLRRFWIQSFLRLELQVRLELGNSIQYLQLSQNLEHPIQISENTFKVHVIQTTCTKIRQAMMKKLYL